MRGQVDFTKDSIVKSLIIFSAPIIFGELLQNFYNSVDALVVGNFIGDAALAAVGVCGQIATLFVNFFNGMSVGSSVVVAQRFGKNNAVAIERAICDAFTFATLLGVVLSVAGIFGTPLLLKFAGTLPDYYAEAETYLRIYLAGLMFTVVYNSGAGILRALGDSRTPFRILIIACIGNIIADFLLVAVFSMGIAGAGLATVLSQSYSTVAVYCAIRKKTGKRCLNVDELICLGSGTVKEILSIGISAGLQSALIALSNIFVIRFLNHFDTVAVAGVGIAQRLDKFIVLPVKSFGITMTTYVSQNRGAEKYERIRNGKNKCILISLVTTAVISLFVYIFAEECVSLFNNNPKVIAIGVSMMQVFIPLLSAVTIREILLGILRGYGKTTLPMILSLIGMVGCRQVFLAISMSRNPIIENIYYCYPVAWLATIILLSGYYFAVKKKLKGLE